MLIEKWKKGKSVKSIIERRKEEIYNEAGLKIKKYEEIKILEKSIRRLMSSDNPNTADKFVNEIKDIIEKYGLTDNTTCISTVLVYLFEVLTY